MKKTLSITVILLFSFTTGYSQWLPGKSCNAIASAISDKAISHMVNLESSMAVGMANAALMVDQNCGTAKLLKINSAMAGNFGDRAEQLENLDVSNLSKTEKAWHAMMVEEEEDWQAARMKAAGDHPNVPLFQFWKAMVSDNQFEGMAEFANDFPKYAAPAYNMISYAYVRGDGVDADMDKALETIEKAIAMHDGPNAYDSRAEHYAAAKDFEKAFESQLKAMNYAAGPPSPYQRNAVIYWRSMNKEVLADSIKAYTKQRLHYTMTNDIEGLSKFQSEGMNMIACNSNMNPCEVVEDTQENTAFTWNEWETDDIDVHFNEEMTMAITTYTSKGKYTMNDSGKVVNYHTRASEVWELDGGWKLVHSNFAPLPDGEGLPKM